MEAPKDSAMADTIQQQPLLVDNNESLLKKSINTTSTVSSHTFDYSEIIKLFDQKQQRRAFSARSGRKKSLLSSSLLNNIPKSALTTRDINTPPATTKSTARDSWWKSTLKETPSFYKYNLPTFVQETTKRRCSFSFKSDGRRLQPHIYQQMQKGEFLLPGAYEFEEFSDRVKKMKITYNFNSKSTNKVKVTETEKHIGPSTYETSKYLSIDATREPVKHFFFKSRSRRRLFDGNKIVPAPGTYEVSKDDYKNVVSSCFRSKTARFKKDKSLAPGPATYEPISVWIHSKQSQLFSSKGVFFTPSARVHY